MPCTYLAVLGPHEPLDERADDARVTQQLLAGRVVGGEPREADSAELLAGRRVLDRREDGDERRDAAVVDDEGMVGAVHREGGQHRRRVLLGVERELARGERADERLHAALLDDARTEDGVGDKRERPERVGVRLDVPAAVLEQLDQRRHPAGHHRLLLQLDRAAAEPLLLVLQPRAHGGR